MLLAQLSLSVRLTCIKQGILACFSLPFQLLFLASCMDGFVWWCMEDIGCCCVVAVRGLEYCEEQLRGDVLAVLWLHSAAGS